MCKLKKFSLHHSLTNYKARTRCLILKSSSGLLRLTAVLARNKILTDDEIIRTVTAEDDDDDDDVTPVNPDKILHSEAGAALGTSLQWAEEHNFEAHEIMFLRRLRDRAFELKIGTAAQRKISDILDTDYVHSLAYVIIMYVHIMFILYHVHSIYPYNDSSYKYTIAPIHTIFEKSVLRYFFITSLIRKSS
ncbi:hypothetical protein AVEN_266206-1 [Araneus ventricosus]|uniref:Uncharacterized protein n=1 Tax=Araneus ventricosus TaxID=182803 RepID=A0A4Y2N5K0_ARAVE|nr:hypothetical protein AVEN_266206-1 [Araneus ventricosus]